MARGQWQNEVLLIDGPPLLLGVAGDVAIPESLAAPGKAGISCKEVLLGRMRYKRHQLGSCVSVKGGKGWWSPTPVIVRYEEDQGELSCCRRQ